MGREAAEPLAASMGLRVRRADAVGDRIYIEGNAAAGLGVRAFSGERHRIAPGYPITPSTSSC